MNGSRGPDIEYISMVGSLDLFFSLAEDRKYKNGKNFLDILSNYV